MPAHVVPRGDDSDSGARPDPQRETYAMIPECVIHGRLHPHCFQLYALANFVQFKPYGRPLKGYGAVAKMLGWKHRTTVAEHAEHLFELGLLDLRHESDGVVMIVAHNPARRVPLIGPRFRSDVEKTDSAGSTDVGSTDAVGLNDVGETATAMSVKPTSDVGSTDSKRVPTCTSPLSVSEENICRGEPGVEACDIVGSVSEDPEFVYEDGMEPFGEEPPTTIAASTSVTITASITAPFLDTPDVRRCRLCGLRLAHMAGEPVEDVKPFCECNMLVGDAERVATAAELAALFRRST